MRSKSGAAAPIARKRRRARVVVNVQRLKAPKAPATGSARAPSKANASGDLRPDFGPGSEQVPKLVGDGGGFARRVAGIPRCALHGAEHHQLANVHAVGLELLDEQTDELMLRRVRPSKTHRV